MRNEGVDIGALEAIALQQLQAGFGLLAYGEFEDLLAVLVYVGHFLIDGFTSSRIEAAASGHLQEASAGAIDFGDEVDQANRIIFGGLEKASTRSLPKKNAGCAISGARDRRHHVG